MSAMQSAYIKAMKALEAKAPIRGNVVFRDFLTDVPADPQRFSTATGSIEPFVGVLSRVANRLQPASDGREARTVLSIRKSLLSGRPNQASIVQITTPTEHAGNFKLSDVRVNQGVVYQLDLAGPAGPTVSPTNLEGPTFSSMVLTPGTGQFGFSATSSEGAIYRLRYRTPQHVGQWKRLKGPSVSLLTNHNSTIFGLSPGTYEVDICGRDALLSSSAGIWGDWHKMGTVVVS